MKKHQREKMEFIYIMNCTIHQSIAKGTREHVGYERKIGRY